MEERNYQDRENTNSQVQTRRMRVIQGTTSPLQRLQRFEYARAAPPTSAPTRRRRHGRRAKSASLRRRSRPNPFAASRGQCPGPASACPHLVVVNRSLARNRNMRQPIAVPRPRRCMCFLQWRHSQMAIVRAQIRR